VENKKKNYKTLFMASNKVPLRNGISIYRRLDRLFTSIYHKIFIQEILYADLFPSIIIMQQKLLKHIKKYFIKNHAQLCERVSKKIHNTYLIRDLYSSSEGCTWKQMKNLNAALLDRAESQL
jgi:hypothetical protein